MPPPRTRAEVQAQKQKEKVRLGFLILSLEVEEDPLQCACPILRHLSFLSGHMQHALSTPSPFQDRNPFSLVLVDGFTDWDLAL